MEVWNIGESEKWREEENKEERREGSRKEGREVKQTGELKEGII